MGCSDRRVAGWRSRSLNGAPRWASWWSRGAATIVPRADRATVARLWWAWYGGEEFAVVTPDTAESAARLAERLREVVCRDAVPTDVGPLTVTISVGVAHADSGEQRIRQILARADAALYEAKQRGRNRV